MGILDKLRAAFEEKPHALTLELEDAAGLAEVLVARMRRHAATARLRLIEKGVAEIAEREAAHEKTLRAMLADRGLWPRPPASTPHDGSNNWERLSIDLAMLGELSVSLSRMSAKWESVDEGVAQQLMAISREAYENEVELRKLALKCDPQALD